MVAKVNIVMNIAKTFEERGVYLAFTTHYTRHARLRVGDDLEWEVLLSGLSGDKGSYVLPWEKLPDLTSLTIHDRALIEALDNEILILPENVRQHGLNINSLGYDGAESMIAASKIIDTDSAVRAAILSRLMSNFCCEVEGGKKGSISPNDLLSEQGQERLQLAFKNFSKSNHITVATIVKHIDCWADLMSCFGCDVEGEQGHLLITLANLQRVADDLLSWVTEETFGSVAKVRHIIDALLSTKDIGDKISKEITNYNENICQSLLQWNDAEKNLTEKLKHLLWVLDGWPAIVWMWDKTLKSHRYQKRISTHMMMQSFPILPEEILSSTQIKLWKDLRKEQLLWRVIGNDFQPINYNQGIVNELKQYPFVDYI